MNGGRKGMDREWIEQRFYSTYVCRFCDETVKGEDLEKHQEECTEQ